MKVYVPTTIADEVLQCGITLSKETAEKWVEKLNANSPKNAYGQPMYEYFIEEYELSEDYTPFND